MSDSFRGMTHFENSAKTEFFAIQMSLEESDTLIVTAMLSPRQIDRVAELYSPNSRKLCYIRCERTGLETFAEYGDFLKQGDSDAFDDSDVPGVVYADGLLSPALHPHMDNAGRELLVLATAGNTHSAA